MAMEYRAIVEVCCTFIAISRAHTNKSGKAIRIRGDRHGIYREGEHG
jgi:hypothetical protein